MNRKTPIFLTGILFVILAVILTFSVSQVQAKKLMFYTFQKGQRFTQRITIEQKVDMTNAGQQQSINQKIGFEYNYQAVEVYPDGSAKLKCTYTWVQFNQKGSGISIDYESSVPEQSLNPMDKDFSGKVFGALIGESFYIIVLPDGQIKDVQGINDLYSLILDKIIIPAGSNISKSQMEYMLQSQFGNDEIKEVMSKSFTQYSQIPIEIGDTWQNSLKLSTGYSMIIENTYKLLERSDEGSLIEIMSTIAPNPEGKSLQLGQMTVKYNITGKQHGTMSVNAFGWAVNGKIIQNFTGTMTMEGQGINLNIPVTAESTILIESHK